MTVAKSNSGVGRLRSFPFASFKSAARKACDEHMFFRNMPSRADAIEPRPQLRSAPIADSFRIDIDRNRNRDLTLSVN
jgi:hypothetical protein